MAWILMNGMDSQTQNNAEPQNNAEKNFNKKFCALLPFPRHSAFQYPPIIPIVPITPIIPIHSPPPDGSAII